MAIVIVEPSSSGLSLLIAAKELGETVYILSADKDDRTLPERYRYDDCQRMQVETNDAYSIVSAVITISLTDNITAVIPGFEYVVDSVSQASALLGLPHLGAMATLQARNKYSCRNVLASHDVRVPRFYKICAIDEAEKAALHVGFPAVLKPTNGCGSLFVKKIHNLSELRNEIAFLLGNNFIDMGLRVGVDCLLEEYIEGSEFSVEGYIGHHGPVVVAVTEKILGAEPYFVEMGHVVDAQLTSQQLFEIEDYIQSVVKAIDMDFGVFHAEIRLSDVGPVLIEIAARLGGDKIHRLVELTHGISLPEVMIRCFQGAPPKYHKKCSNRVSAVGFFAPETRKYIGISDSLINKIRTFNGFQEFEVYFNPGEAIPPLTDFRGRLGHILLTAENRRELDVNMHEALNLISQAIN